MAEKFIQESIKRKGALKAFAVKAGVLKSKEDKLTPTLLERLIQIAKKQGNTRVLREANLAKTLFKLAKKKKKK